MTDAAGTASLGTLRDGSYRLRFERDGFITLEREISIRNAEPSTIEVALSFAPPAAPPPAPAPSAPPTPPPPVVVTVPAPRLTSVPSGPPVFVSIPDFLDKNYIGREPIKESVLACLADSTTRVLQLHEAIGEHTHADMDEVLYIVAGEGTIRTRGESSTVAASRHRGCAERHPSWCRARDRAPRQESADGPVDAVGRAVPCECTGWSREPLVCTRGRDPSSE